jgi:hypothetical protein
MPLFHELECVEPLYSQYVQSGEIVTQEHYMKKLVFVLAALAAVSFALPIASADAGWHHHHHWHHWHR